MQAAVEVAVGGGMQAALGVAVGEAVPATMLPLLSSVNVTATHAPYIRAENASPEAATLSHTSKDDDGAGAEWPPLRQSTSASLLCVAPAPP